MMAPSRALRYLALMTWRPHDDSCPHCPFNFRTAGASLPRAPPSRPSHACLEVLSTCHATPQRLRRGLHPAV